MAYGDSDETYAAEVGERLASLREPTGLSPEGLCDGLSISGAALRLYEAGRSVPGGLAIKELAFALGITSDWLLGIPPVRQR
ncbi:MAG: helix-turn-helix transcriptional regulator [Nannocystaceae bacterium]